MIRVTVRASVPYPAIAAQALAALERRPFPIDAGPVHGQVHVTDVLVRPVGTQLAVAVGFRAELAWPLPRVRGVVHLQATPVYDGDTQRLRLRDVSFTGDVDHVLARAALSFKRGVILEALRTVSLDLEPWLRGLGDRLNASLSGTGSAPQVALHGHVETIRVDDIVLAEDLVVVASASGELRVTFDPRAGA